MMVRSSNNKRRAAILLGAAVTCFAIAVLVLVRRTESIAGLFLTPDQQAQRLFDKKDYRNAAARFSHPLRQGAAFYRAGDYQKAVAAFARVNSAEGHFDRGNALVMLGKYDDAIKAYDRSLTLRPKWQPAVQNHKIARRRADRVKREGGDMTGGKLGADEIVFEPGKSKDQAEQTEVATGGKEMSDKELQTLWRRRVQTKPADFLRAKFAFQLAAANDKTGATGQQ